MDPGPVVVRLGEQWRDTQCGCSAAESASAANISELSLKCNAFQTHLRHWFERSGPVQLPLEHTMPTSRVSSERFH